MRKLNLQSVILFFVSLWLLTSCIDGEEQNRQSGTTVGVVRTDYESGKNLLDVSAVDAFYSIRFAQDKEGDCFLVTYLIDYDREENSNANLIANGYYTVDIMLKEDVNKWAVNSMLTDTSKTLLNEVEIQDPIWDGDYMYIKGVFFMYHLIEIPTDQNMAWNLSYDYDNLSSEEDGQRCYDIYLRATIRREGDRSKEKITIANAFEMKNYMEMVANKEKESGKSEFRLRIHYPYEINEDGQITWKSKHSREISVSSIIEVQKE